MREQAFNDKKAALTRCLAMLAVVCILNASTVAQNNRQETVNQKVNAVLQSIRGADKSNAWGNAKSSAVPRFSQTEDGYLTFLGAPPDHDFPVTAAVHGNPQSTAKNFVKEHNVEFGIRSSEVDFVTKKLHTRGSRHHVRFQQTYADIPVFGAEIIIQLNNADGVEYVLSDIMRNTESLDTGQLAIIPAVAPEEAQRIAVNMVAQNNPDLNYTTQEPNLMIYQPSVLGNAGKTRLVWQTTVTTAPMPQAAEFVLVDAHNGEIALHYSLIKNAKYRRIYDLQNTCEEIQRRQEGDPPYVLVPDVDYAYDYLGDTYDFYFNYHSRDSINGYGMTMIADVRDCLPFGAYWYLGRIYFEQGWVADDVTGHELTHGVTEYESNLIYEYEPGAINESFSDMWGEWIDQTNGKGDDSASVKWLLGEDTPSGAIRSMEDPPTYGCPDRMGSPLWYSGPDDNGGVHTNSGVGNKLCYLLTDGSTFNGHSVTGTGIEKTADLFYEVQTNLLSSAADYSDLYYALTQAAINLGWSTAEKQNLEQACEAVEIGFTAEPPVVPDSISYPTENATGQYTVSWPTSSGATSYQLERSDNAGSTWSQVYSDLDTSYSEIVGGGSYRYRVKASNANGSSDWRTGTWDCVVDVPGCADEYVSADVPKTISDHITVNSTMVISQSGSIFDINVKLNITHTYDSDLDVFLIAPDATRVELFTDVGSGGNNFTDTVIDDEAATAITAGTAPFTGTYRPEGSLAALDGKNFSGTWILEITDDAGGDQGTLDSWSLIIGTTCNLADFDEDGDVDTDDLGTLCASWLTDDAVTDIAPSPDGDGIVDMQDFAIFAQHWLEGT